MVITHLTDQTEILMMVKSYYIREDIPSYLIATGKEPMESFWVELNLRDEKYLINYSYNLQKTAINNHLAT